MQKYAYVMMSWQRRKQVMHKVIHSLCGQVSRAKCWCRDRGSIGMDLYSAGTKRGAFTGDCGRFSGR